MMIILAFFLYIVNEQKKNDLFFHFFCSFVLFLLLLFFRLYCFLCFFFYYIFSSSLIARQQYNKKEVKKTKIINLNFSFLYKFDFNNIVNKELMTAISLIKYRKKKHYLWFLNNNEMKLHNHICAKTKNRFINYKYMNMYHVSFLPFQLLNI